jgi:hypothetical protein
METTVLDCFVASLLAMTTNTVSFCWLRFEPDSKHLPNTAAAFALPLLSFTSM